VFSLKIVIGYLDNSYHKDSSNTQSISVFHIVFRQIIMLTFTGGDRNNHFS